MKRISLFLAFLYLSTAYCFSQPQTIEFNAAMHGIEFKGKPSSWTTHVNITMYVGGGSFSTPGGVVSTPGYWSNPGFNYASKSGQGETYFKTFLKKESLDFIPSTNIDTKYDKIDHAEDILKDVIAAEMAFDFNQKTYLFYSNKKTKKFIIE